MIVEISSLKSGDTFRFIDCATDLTVNLKGLHVVWFRYPSGKLASLPNNFQVQIL